MIKQILMGLAAAGARLWRELRQRKAIWTAQWTALKRQNGCIPATSTRMCAQFRPLRHGFGSLKAGWVKRSAGRSTAWRHSCRSTCRRASLPSSAGSRRQTLPRIRREAQGVNREIASVRSAPQDAHRKRRPRLSTAPARGRSTPCWTRRNPMPSTWPTALPKPWPTSSGPSMRA